MPWGVYLAKGAAHVVPMPLTVIQHGHSLTPQCWCHPELRYTEPVSGAQMWTHKSKEQAS